MDAISTLQSWLDDASNIVFFTGAGISTESGIPDFRSPGTGLWTKMKPIMFQDFLASQSVRDESWRRKFDNNSTISSAQPNAGHNAIAELSRAGRLRAVITQNIDNLHQDSGLPDDAVIELHGNASYATCLDCGHRFELDELEGRFQRQGTMPDCEHCTGIIKTATISFGQAMPEQAMSRAQQATTDADLFIVVGSSLTVQPAAGFPELAHHLGCRLAILNREETPLDPIADLVLHEEIGQTLAFAVGLNA
ncbi:MAG: Sir2 family NAD-dependent protein deacetylase [Pseudomonadaceae bacterium]|nr:Sir2 family NAD-dependent protein deacetylase [Pseudomonadaceae bacterium]